MRITQLYKGITIEFPLFYTYYVSFGKLWTNRPFAITHGSGSLYNWTMIRIFNLYVAIKKWNTQSHERNGEKA